MDINVSLNKRLYSLFCKSFKSDLVYYNNSGILYYICNHFEIGNLNRYKFLSEQNIENLYLKDFKKNLHRSNEKRNIKFNNMKYDEIKFIDKLVSYFSSEEIFDSLEIIKVYRATVINYMMFYILVQNGFIELQFYGDNNNFNNFNNFGNSNNFNIQDYIENDDENNLEDDQSPENRRIILE